MGCADSTDRHILRGEYPARLPVTLGHEFAGEVVAAGAEAALPVGARRGGPQHRLRQLP
jgi:threonine dehydrogenase-like Zn-dependent dehydrogenase